MISRHPVTPLTFLHSDLSGFTCSDEDVEDLVSEYVQDMPALTSLHTVNLSRTSVTGAGVKLLVDHLPALTTLLIDQCSSITSRDIVTYAEKKGINVSFKQFTDRYGGGRKVRYG